MGLVPPRISVFIKQKDVPSMLDSGLMVCMECGCCSFVCPANRPIVQNMRLGKSIVRNAKVKEGK